MRNDNADISAGATPTPSSGAADSRRRRLIKGAAAGTGVFLAVQARTALGTTQCQSPSAMISGNQSPRPGDGHTCSGGRSPGFWKQPQHFSYWGPSGLQYPTFDTGITACSTGLGNVTPCDITNPGTPLGSLLPGAPGQINPDTGKVMGVWEVLVWPTNYPTYGKAGCQGKAKEKDIFNGQGQLMRALIVAYLNAGWFNSTGQDYPITAQQVIDMWNAVKNGGRYCPPNMSCSGGGMSAQDIISYIEGMYDINADINVNLCKTQY